MNSPGAPAPPPAPNLNASPAAVVGAVVFFAALMALPKRKRPKYRRRLLAHIADACRALEPRAGVAGIADRDPQAQAQARADAAAALQLLINSLTETPK